MRMGPHIEALASPQCDGTHLVKEDERPNQPALRRGEHTPNLESSYMEATPRSGLDNRSLSSGATAGWSQYCPE
jgi:hypothetical protein